MKILLSSIIMLCSIHGFAQIAQSSDAYIEQLQANITSPILSGSSAVSLVSQAGKSNTVNILQTVGNLPSGVSALVVQDGEYNSARLDQKGNNIHSRLLQTGSYNKYDVTAMGENIYSNVVQDGYGNRVQTLTTGQSEGNAMGRPYEVIQRGNNNALQLNHGTDIKPYTIEQKGNNMRMSIETIRPVFQ